jgi:hypothetical protein
MINFNELLHDGPSAQMRDDWQSIPIALRWAFLVFTDAVTISSYVRDDRRSLTIEITDRHRRWGTEIYRETLEDSADPEWVKIHALRKCADEAPGWCYRNDDPRLPTIALRRLRAWMREQGRPVPPLPTHAWLDDGRPR